MITTLTCQHSGKLVPEMENLITPGMFSNSFYYIGPRLCDLRSTLLLSFVFSLNLNLNLNLNLLSSSSLLSLYFYLLSFVFCLLSFPLTLDCKDVHVTHSNACSVYVGGVFSTKYSLIVKRHTFVLKITAFYFYREQEPVL